MALKLYTAPTSEPISLADAKKQLRLPSAYTSEDDAINWYIKAAREIAERETNRALLTQTWKLTLDKFPASGVIQCSKNPVIAITSIQYYDTAGDLQTWSADNYILDDQREPWRITPAYGLSFPSTQSRINAVTITFTAGYSSADTIPANIMQGMRLIIGDLYKNRENIVIGRLVSDISRNAIYAFHLERIEDHHTGNYV